MLPMPTVPVELMTSVTKDTTISDSWDGAWKVLRITDSRIKGNGTLTRWYIDASAYQQVFDSSIKFGEIKIYDAGAFSPMWIGANPAINDNYEYLQKSINLSVNNFPLSIPSGNYKYSKSLTAKTITNGIYTATYLNMYGAGDIWNSSTTLNYTGYSGFAFGIQLAKGGSISNLKFKGQFTPPVNNGIAYYNIKQEDYNDINNKCAKDNYSGVVIDYDGTKNTGGSTGLTVSETIIDGFDVAYDISPNGKTFNADLLLFDNIQGSNARVVFRSAQAQEKGNIINRIASWGNVHTLFQSGYSGKYQGGSWTINNGNIAGNCIRLFHISQTGWNSLSVNGLYAEGIATIGDVNTGDSRYAPIIKLDDLRVRFALQATAGVQTLFTANNTSVLLENCTLWYYGDPGRTLNFKGTATELNNNYSGPVNWIQ